MEYFKSRISNFKFQILNLKFLLLVAAVLLPVVSGCSHNDVKKQSAKPLSQAEIDRQIKNHTITDVFLRTQVDFGLESRRSSSNRIQATLRNKTAAEVLVGPNCFALIIPATKQTVKASPESLKLFPITKVAPGQEVSGELIFPLDPIPASARLAFNNPDAGQPAMAAIR